MTNEKAIAELAKGLKELARAVKELTNEVSVSNGHNWARHAESSADKVLQKFR